MLEFAAKKIESYLGVNFNWKSVFFSKLNC
jgi:hypothetical protein